MHIYPGQSGGTSARRQIAAARRLLRHPLGPCTRGNGSAADPPLRHTQRLLLPFTDIDVAQQEQPQQHVLT